MNMINNVMDLTNDEVYEILTDLRSKRIGRADVMLGFFELSDIRDELLPPDASKLEGQFKKILMVGAMEGFI